MRLRVYVFGSLLLWVALFVRLSFLQVVSGGEYKKIAEVQHKAEVEIAAERGRIFDRDMEPLAVSYECRSCYAHPQVVQDPHKAASQLSKIGLGPRSEILKKLKAKKGFVWLKRKVSPQLTEKIRSLKIDGICLMSDLERAYPKGIAGNVIGFCGGETIGLEGIEYEFDGVLGGTPGKMVVQKDARGQVCPLPEYPKRDPQKGLDIVLNIDADLQSIAEKELARGVDKFNARAATCVIINPSTGEVLSIANVPSYNPNRRGDGTPDEWRNRAITDIFEPGSTLKIIALASALEEGLLTRDDTIEVDSGRIVVQSVLIEDVKKYKSLTAAEVLIYSSNVGVVKVAQGLGRPKLYEYLRAFGFGNRMGIDLPGEVKGILAPPDEWSDIRLANIAIGQGISATAIQLAYAFGAVANKGILMKPTIVKRIVDPGGNVVRQFEPTEVRRVISERTANELVEILTEAVEYGTGVKAKYAGLPVAGKTGTAQKLDENGRYSHKQYTSSFCGFFPAQEAKILMSIVVDEPHGSYYYGGDVACSIFKEITVKMVNLRDYRYLAYENQDEEETVANRF